MSLRAYAPSKEPDLPIHAYGGQRSDLNLRWPHMLEDPFSRVTYLETFLSFACRHVLCICMLSLLAA